MTINNHRPFPNTGGWDSTQLAYRPPSNVLDAATNTLVAKVDTLRTKFGEAGRTWENLKSKKTEDAAIAADLRAAADAATAGTAIPGKTAWNQWKADVAAAQFSYEAHRIALDEAISALNVKRSALYAAGSADTNTAAADLAASIEALKAKFTTYVTLEARDSWYNGGPYYSRTNVLNGSLLPGLYSPSNVNGEDTHPVAVVIDQLKLALGKGI